MNAQLPQRPGFWERYFGLDANTSSQQIEDEKNTYRYYGNLLEEIAKASPWYGETTAVFGGKGGVGKTLTAAALAECDHLATQLDTAIADFNKALRTLPDRLRIKLNNDLLTIADMAENLKLLLQVRKNKLLKQANQDVNGPTSVNPEDLNNFFLHAAHFKQLVHFAKSRLMLIPHGMTSNRHFDIRTIMAVCMLIKRNVHSLFIDTGNEPFDVFNEAAMRFADKRYFVCLATDNATVKTMLDTMRAYFDRGYQNAVRQALICYSQTIGSDTHMTLFEVMLECVDGDEAVLKDLGIERESLKEKIYLLPKNRKLGGDRTSSFDPFSFSPLKRNSIDKNDEFVGIEFAIATAQFRLALLRQPKLTAEQRKEDVERANQAIHEFNMERAGDSEIESTIDIDLDELFAELVILPNVMKDAPVAAIEQ